MKYFLQVLLILMLSIFIVGCSQNPDTAGTVSKTTVSDAASTTTPDVTSNTASDSASTTSGTSKITESELASHNSENDCWIAYDGSVYDITSYLPMHPKVDISEYCGTSTAFEEAFTQQHGTKYVSMLEKVGTFKGTLG